MLLRVVVLIPLILVACGLPDDIVIPEPAVEVVELRLLPIRWSIDASDGFMEVELENGCDAADARVFVDGMPARVTERRINKYVLEYGWIELPGDWWGFRQDRASTVSFECLRPRLPTQRYASARAETPVLFVPWCQVDLRLRLSQFSASADGRSIRVAFHGWPDPASLARNFGVEGVPGTATVDGDERGATFTPDAPFEAGRNYRAIVQGGDDGVRSHGKTKLRVRHECPDHAPECEREIWDFTATEGEIVELR